MTVRTKGDLCGLTVRTEQTYGKIDSAGTSLYGGTLLSVSTSGDTVTEQEVFACTRLRQGVFRTAAAFGLTATFNHVRGQDWEKWIEYATGSLDGVQRQSDSFDTVFRVAEGENHLFTGCRVNSLSVSASDIGALVEFRADIMARWHTMTPFKDSDGTALSMALASIPSGAPITYSRKWEYSTNGTDFQPIPGKSWTLQINQNLQGEPDVNDPDDDSAYKLEAGSDSVPQASEITLEITVTSSGPEWDRLRMAYTTGMTLRCVIDGMLVTLKGCSLGVSGPDRSATGSYDETISLTATDIVVTEAS